jgi:2-oxoglutarate ferredoxin oxidoreductase subunit beta
VKARRVLKTSFELQRDNKCFTFVEVLSTCPTNWGLTPFEATKWLQEHMVPYYPVQNFKKFEETPEVKAQVTAEPAKEA